MNFVKRFQEGKAGHNFGLPTGIKALDKAINGIQKKTSIGLAAAPKVGKTTLCDYSFLIKPYLFMLEQGRLNEVNWIYFSFEIDRISKEFKVAAFFMAHDFGIYSFVYKGTTYKMSQDYLEGVLVHDKGDGTTELVQITEEHEEMLKTVYVTRIVPIFGEYDIETGKKIKNGVVDFIEQKDNPTGMYKYLLKYAKANGEFIEESYTTLDDNNNQVTRKRIVGYKEKNPKLFTIIITDHIRKLRKERGFLMKENIDKWLEYTTELRNLCLFTFINICHSNRGIANVDRLKYAGEYVYPTADDIKDTGNLAEESTILITMFNPNDEKYNLTKHFGVNNREYPDYVSIHIAESRKTESPQHIQNRMIGGVNTFLPLENFES